MSCPEINLTRLAQALGCAETEFKGPLTFTQIAWGYVHAYGGWAPSEAEKQWAAEVLELQLKTDHTLLSSFQHQIHREVAEIYLDMRSATAEAFFAERQFDPKPWR